MLYYKYNKALNIVFRYFLSTKEEERFFMNVISAKSFGFGACFRFYIIGHSDHFSDQVFIIMAYLSPANY